MTLQLLEDLVASERIVTRIGLGGDAAGAESVIAERAAGLKKSWSLPTLESYLVQRGNLKLVARELGVHINTVKYRLAILRRQLATRIDDGDVALELLFALRLRKILSNQ